MTAPDMEVIKDIPGYKVILKAIIKSQIQQLVEQLATHTDEESVILTASVSDGTLSHLGSASGKSFLEEQEDVKSQFLGFCLRRHHKQKQAEKEKERLQSLATHTHMPGQMDMGPGPRPRMPFHSTPRHQFPFHGNMIRSPRHEPYHIPKTVRRTGSGSDIPGAGFGHSVPGDQSKMTIIKTEPSDTNDGENNDNMNQNDENTNTSNPSDNNSGGDNSHVDPDNVKVEAISESEFELEITGVEPGVQSQSVPQPDSWDANTSMNFDPNMGATGSAADLSSQQGYIMIVADDGTKVWQCDICARQFTTKQRVQRHYLCHTGVKPYECWVCKQRFTQKHHMKSHVITRHRNSLSVNE